MKNIIKQNKLKLFFDRDRIYLYPWYFAEQCLTDDIEKIFGMKIEKTILEFKKGYLYSYIDTDRGNEIGKFLFEKVKKDKKFYKKVEKNILSTGKQLTDFCNKVGQLKYSGLSNKKLVEIYNEYGKKLRIMRAWGWVPPLLDGMEIPFLSNYIQEKFKQFLQQTNKGDKFAEYYSVLSSSEKKSEVQNEELARLMLVEKIKKLDSNYIELLRNNISEFVLKMKENPAIYNAIKNHAKKFAWLTYAYIGPVMSETDVIKLMSDSLKQKNSIEIQINNIKNHYTELKQEKKEILSSIKLPGELKYLFEVSAFFMFLKDHRKGIYQKSYVSMDPIIIEITKRTKLTFDEVKYLTQEEIEEVLVNNKDFSNVVKQRMEYCVAITEEGKTKVYQGNEAKEIISNHIINEKIDTDAKEIKGMVAYSGKVTGIAKIVLTTKDISKIKEGEVLVSSATNPDLILAMKKASAFVTDFGGVISHAAIVSREMKKPCVVGTKIATKVIKDGDLIEVDANSGIVKILKSN